jgi:hypothetical protein
MTKFKKKGNFPISLAEALRLGAEFCAKLTVILGIGAVGAGVWVDRNQRKKQQQFNNNNQNN